MESTETKQGIAFLFKEKVIPPDEVSENVEPLLKEFKGDVYDEFQKDYHL